MAVKSLKCSGLHTREIDVPNCVDGQPCKRVYRLFLPRVLCHGGARSLGRTPSGPASSDRDRDSALADEASSESSTAKQRRDGDGDYENDPRRRRRAEYDGYFEGEYVRVGTLPLAFLLHGYGSDSSSMMGFLSLADAYHFVLVLPELGIDGGEDCCGTTASLRRNVDDVAFLSRIRSSLTEEFASFLKPDFSYAIGYGNGARLATLALERDPHFFRSVVLVSGYGRRGVVDGMRERLGTGRGRNGVGIMMHHSLDDVEARPGGCCDDADAPTCGSEIAVESPLSSGERGCVSVLEAYDTWARDINGCDGDGDGDDAGFRGHIVGAKSGEAQYALFHDGESNGTVLSLRTEGSGEERPGTTSHALYETHVPLSVSYRSSEATCLTATSGCVANSTLCLYANKGNFAETNFGNEFPMFGEASEFLAREACGANDGMLEVLHGSSKHACACVVTGRNYFGGAYCMDALNEDGSFEEQRAPSSAQTTNGEPIDASAAVASERPTPKANETLVAPSSGLGTPPKPAATEPAAPPREAPPAAAPGAPGSPREQNETSVASSSASESSTNSGTIKPADSLEPNEIIDNSPASLQGQGAASVASASALETSPDQAPTESAPPPSGAPPTSSSSTLDSTQKQNEALIASVSASETPQNPVATESATLSKPHGTIYDHSVATDMEKTRPEISEIILVASLLVMLIILGVAYRRRWMRKRKLAVVARYQDAGLIASALSPYRDYFQGGGNVDNEYGEYGDDGEISACELAILAQYSSSGDGGHNCYQKEVAAHNPNGNFENGDSESEHGERSSPYRYEDEPALANRDDKTSAHNIGGGSSSAGWVERGLPYRYDRGAEITKQHIMDDYSFGINNLLHEIDPPASRSDHNAANGGTGRFGSASQQPRRARPESLHHVIDTATSRYDPNAKEKIKRRIMNDHVSAPDSLLNAGESPDSRLDPADGRTLRRFHGRGQDGDQGGASEIIWRRADPEESVSVRSNSFLETKGNVDVLDEDLERIESEIT